MDTARYDVLIAGAGPTGLLLALLLAKCGLRARVIEKRAGRSGLSRSIGIHPASLAILERAGVDGEFIRRGCKVRRGIAFKAGRGHPRRLGAVDFSALPGPHPFVLTLPQSATEEILEKALLEVDGDALARGMEATAVQDLGDAVALSARDAGGGIRLFEGACLAACDGSRSRVREAAGIGFNGGPYPGSFAMCDFRDARGGDEAWIFLDGEGFVESFPLPGGIRRWVLAARHGSVPHGVEEFRREAARRVSHELADAVGDPAVFACERYMGERCARGRIALAGDAAHVISPVGGQGMNIGWLDAADLADALADIVRRGAPAEQRLAAYDRRVRARARWAARRAERFMEIGFARVPVIRDFALGLALRSPLRASLARHFAMLDLRSGIRGV